MLATFGYGIAARATCAGSGMRGGGARLCLSVRVNSRDNGEEKLKRNEAQIRSRAIKASDLE